MAKDNLVGKWVYYHGSIVRAHGYALVETTHAPFVRIDDNDTIRYVLRYGPDYDDILTNVRRVSFTRVNKEGFKK